MQAAALFAVCSCEVGSTPGPFALESSGPPRRVREPKPYPPSITQISQMPAAYVHFNGPTDQLSTMCTGMAVLDPGASPHPPHTHPEEEFMIVAAGTGEIECAGKTTQVGPGSIMYCAGGVLHGIVNTGTTP